MLLYKPFKYANTFLNLLFLKDYKPPHNIHPKEVKLDRSQTSVGDTEQKPKNKPGLKLFRYSDFEKEMKQVQFETHNRSSVVQAPHDQKSLQDGKCVRTSLLVNIYYPN